MRSGGLVPSLRRDACSATRVILYAYKEIVSAGAKKDLTTVGNYIILTMQMIFLTIIILIENGDAIIIC